MFTVLLSIGYMLLEKNSHSQSVLVTKYPQPIGCSQYLKHLEPIFKFSVYFRSCSQLQIRTAQKELKGFQVFTAVNSVFVFQTVYQFFSYYLISSQKQLLSLSSHINILSNHMFSQQEYYYPVIILSFNFNITFTVYLFPNLSINFSLLHNQQLEVFITPNISPNYLIKSHVQQLEVLLSCQHLII